MKTLPDPTADEMLLFLLSQPCRSEDDKDNALAAIYWFAAEWHGGQSSNLYSALCMSPYSPGPCGTLAREDDAVREMVCDLEEKFAGVDHSNTNPGGLDLKRGPVWMLWHGGSSYASPGTQEREDCEPFATLADALAEFDARPGDSFTPCVSRQSAEYGGPLAQIYFSDPFGNGDAYPDAEIQFNARGVAVVSPC